MTSPGLEFGAEKLSPYCFLSLTQIFSYVQTSRSEEDYSDIAYSSANNDYSEDHRHYIELCHGFQMCIFLL
jgi:hypothetical protein